MIEKKIVNGVEIACWVNRQEWNDGRKTLVFIHGSGADHNAWVFQCEGLKNDYNLVAIELPGHGGSGKKGEEDVGAYVDWVRDICAVFGAVKPVLIGHSLGAAIALSFAIKYGALISAIVPFGGGVKMPVNPMILEGVKKDLAGTLAMTAKFAVAKQNREKLAPMLAKRSPIPEVMYGDFLACDRLDITAEVKDIKVPTLIICGTEDKMTPPALSESLRDMIPGAKLALIPDAGHMVMMEAPDAFNEAVRVFVKTLP